MFRQLMQYKTAHGHCFVPLRCRESPKLGAWLAQQCALYRKGHLRVERQLLLEGAGFQWDFDEPPKPKATREEQNELMWERKLALLTAFKEEHGHCQVPPKWKAAPVLGHWVATQRSLYRTGRLHHGHQQRLDQIGFVWKAGRCPNTIGWERRFAQFAAFQQQHGHLHVTLKSETSPGLMNWRDNQRVSQRNGTLAPERKTRLDALGFEWETPGRPVMSMLDLNLALWERMFAQLLTFKEQHGHCQVPGQWKENPTLAKWVQRQRGHHKSGSLSRERTERLDQIGFAWTSDKLHNTFGWEKRFAELVAFQQQHGHLRVTLKSETSPGLMHWRDNQRVNLRDGTLAPERKARLDAIGFEWETPGRVAVNRDEQNTALWERMFAQLLTFKDQHGHCQVPRLSKEHPALGSWVSKQRALHKGGHMPHERTHRLDQIGFAWKAGRLNSALVWDRRFAQLIAFQQQHGHLRVTRRNETAPGLMHWRDNQRVSQRKGTLAPERKARLDAIGFEWQCPGRLSPRKYE